MSFNVGLNIVEVDGKATPSIQAAPTSVTGFIIKSARGIPGKVRRVTNWSQFIEYFGEYVSNANGAYSVRGFFDNGGQTAHVTRVVNVEGAGNTPAMVSTNDGPWNLTDGDTLTFSIDGGGAIVVTFFDGPAIATGLVGPFDLSIDNTISFIVNGVAADDYTFVVSDSASIDLAGVTVDEVAAVINREFAGIRAFNDGGNIGIRTDRGDSDASLSISGSAATVLGLDAVAPASGNVANIDNILPDELVTILNTAFLGSDVSVAQVENTITITHDIGGSAHSIQVTPGGVESILDLQVRSGTDADGSTSAIAAHVSLQASGANALGVTAAYRGEADRGAWGNDLEIALVENEDDNSRFDLMVKHDDTVVETWASLSMDAADTKFVKDVINDEFSGSKYIMVDATGGTQPDETRSNGNITYEKLGGGDDGSFASRSDEVNAYTAAVDLFDLVEIQLLCCPEAHEGALVSAALTHCKAKGDRMFAGHTPPNMGASSIRSAYSSNFQGDKVYGALYFPWIQINDPIGKRKWIPPVGHILGVYARTERERGIWKAPAGSAAKVNGALDVQFHINDIDHTNLVKKASVNAVRFIPGKGIIVDSSRTLSTNTLWLYVNVRLLFNFVKSSLVSGLRWVVQEPHNESLWNKVKYNSVTPFLMGLWRRGAFGPGSPDEVFTVKVDAENNPPANIQQGIFTTEIYFYPSRPAETVVIVVGQQEGAGSASEG